MTSLFLLWSIVGSRWLGCSNLSPSFFRSNESWGLSNRCHVFCLLSPAPTFKYDYSLNCLPPCLMSQSFTILQFKHICHSPTYLSPGSAKGVISGQDGSVEEIRLKGILHQKNFYCLNLIFWIVMGCGIARFGRRGLKTTET